MPMWDSCLWYVHTWAKHEMQSRTTDPVQHLLGHNYGFLCWRTGNGMLWASSLQNAQVIAQELRTFRLLLPDKSKCSEQKKRQVKWYLVQNTFYGSDWSIQTLLILDGIWDRSVIQYVAASCNTTSWRLKGWQSTLKLVDSIITWRKAMPWPYISKR